MVDRATIAAPRTEGLSWANIATKLSVGDFSAPSHHASYDA